MRLAAFIIIAIALASRLAPKETTTNMTDKERILMYILDGMYYTQTMCLRGVRESQFKDDILREYTHFGCYDDRVIKAGDLVMAQSHQFNDWKIGWVHKVVSGDFMVIREIGTGKLCDWSNERFVRIVGVREEYLLEGDEYVFRQKVIRAFAIGGEYLYRFGGVEFPSEKTAKIFVREVFGGLNQDSLPFSFEMVWNKRTSVKKILETMRENGYGTRKFETR